MKKEEKGGKKHESKIETGDVFNRVFGGIPTIGGLIIVGILIVFVIYHFIVD